MKHAAQLSVDQLLLLGQLAGYSRSEAARMILEANTAKDNPDPGPGIAHDFHCTHDPCVCES